MSIAQIIYLSSMGDTFLFTQVGRSCCCRAWTPGRH